MYLANMLILMKNNVVIKGISQNSGMQRIVLWSLTVQLFL